MSCYAQCTENLVFFILFISLQDFVKYNESLLKQLPCHIFDPVPLGEGAGIGLLKGVDSVPVPESSILYDLVQIGIKQTHAAVGVVLRLRKELSLVKDIPVLFAIDQVRQILESNSHIISFSSLNELSLRMPPESFHSY